MSGHPKCPRCGGGIPNDHAEGAYPGALSRLDNTTEICSACGSDEAWFNFVNPGAPLPPIDRRVLEGTQRSPFARLNSETP